MYQLPPTPHPPRQVPHVTLNMIRALEISCICGCRREHSELSPLSCFMQFCIIHQYVQSVYSPDLKTFCNFLKWKINKKVFMDQTVGFSNKLNTCLTSSYHQNTAYWFALLLRELSLRDNKGKANKLKNKYAKISDGNKCYCTFSDYITFFIRSSHWHQHFFCKRAVSAAFRKNNIVLQ